MNGNILVQVEQEVSIKTDVPVKYDKFKKPIPQEYVPNSSIKKKEWVTQHVLGPGMSVPVQFLFFLRDRS